MFWELRRRKKTLYYCNENGEECDFVVCSNNKVEEVIQVCYTLNSDNEKREVNGLLDVMEFFDLDKGTIITFDQEDMIMEKGRRVEVMPVWEFFG